MIRRLSNFKSSNQQNKSLLDYSYFDHKLYGYENEGCIAFNTIDDAEHDQNTPDTFGELIRASYHPSETADALEESLDTHRQNPDNANKGFGVLALDSDSSDSDSGSPVPQKKGIRRFFCMPKKSTFKGSSATSSAGSSLRRSLRRPKKQKDASLIDA